MKRANTAFVLAFLLPATALAGPQVTPQDIIDHFTGKTAAAAEPRQEAGIVIPDRPQGMARSVHIGAAGFGEEAGVQIPVAAASESETALPPTGAADPGAYDLLIGFDLDSATLRAEARRHLDAFVQALQSPVLSGHRFLVEGHTDATGPAAYNLDLSRRRAAAVVDYLVEHGIDPGRLTARGVGETRPRIADPQDPANRRVETRLMDQE